MNLRVGSNARTRKEIEIASFVCLGDVPGKQFAVPARSAVSAGANDVVYKDRPEDRKVFARQTATVPPKLSRNYSLPYFAKLNTVLNDQLDSAFTANQRPDLTAQNIVSGLGGIFERI